MFGSMLSRFAGGQPQPQPAPQPQPQQGGFSGIMGRLRGLGQPPPQMGMPQGGQPPIPQPQPQQWGGWGGAPGTAQNHIVGQLQGLGQMHPAVQQAMQQQGQLPPALPPMAQPVQRPMGMGGMGRRTM